MPCVSINASSKTLRDSRLVDRLPSAMDEIRLQPSDLAVEILEATLVADPEDLAARTVDRLNHRGFDVELDHFGTG